MLLLLAMMATLAVSCGGDGDDEDTSDTIAITTQGEQIDESVRFDLDPDLNYNGAKINVLAYEGYFTGNNDETASAISRAKYNQQAKTADRLGIEFTMVTANPYTEVSNMVTQSINTQTDDYQIVLGAANNVLGLVNSGYFISVDELTHVDFDKKWWNKEYAESISVNSDVSYILFGDLNYNMIERTTAMVFNKDLLLERHGMTDGEIYDLVMDGEWTIDKFVELAEGFYADNGNGNTNNDIDDTHAISIRGTNEFEYMVFSAGVEFSGRDDDGYPELFEAPTERMIDVVDKLLPILTGQDTFYTWGTNYTSNDYAKVKFASGNALFLPTRLFVAGWAEIIGMEDDYGIIPMPKYDETVDGYHCAVGNAVIWGLVPTVVEDPDMVSAVLESLAYEGYNETSPTYFEENLKLKYTRGDDVDAESLMLDLIRDGARTDFLYINRLGSLGNAFADSYTAKSNTLVSSYASNITAAQQTLQDLIETLEG